MRHIASQRKRVRALDFFEPKPKHAPVAGACQAKKSRRPAVVVAQV